MRLQTKQEGRVCRANAEQEKEDGLREGKAAIPAFRTGNCSLQRRNGFSGGLDAGALVRGEGGCASATRFQPRRGRRGDERRAGREGSAEAADRVRRHGVSPGQRGCRRGQCGRRCLKRPLPSHRQTATGRRRRAIPWRGRARRQAPSQRYEHPTQQALGIRWSRVREAGKGERCSGMWSVKSTGGKPREVLRILVSPGRRTSDERARCGKACARKVWSAMSVFSRAQRTATGRSFGR